MTPQFATGNTFIRDGMIWEIRGMNVVAGEIIYFAVPYNASAQGLNLAPIFVKESELINE